jgi:hypothetical protein
VRRPAPDNSIPPAGVCRFLHPRTTTESGGRVSQLKTKTQSTERGDFASLLPPGRGTPFRAGPMVESSPEQKEVFSADDSSVRLRRLTSRRLRRRKLGQSRRRANFINISPNVIRDTGGTRNYPHHQRFGSGSRRSEYYGRVAKNGGGPRPFPPRSLAKIESVPRRPIAARAQMPPIGC